MQMQDVDVVIVGGGMVGLGLAAALKNRAIKVAIVEGRLPDATLGETPDNRVSALSLASQHILQGALLRFVIEHVIVSEERHIGALSHGLQGKEPASVAALSQHGGAKPNGAGSRLAKQSKTRRKALKIFQRHGD